MHSSTDKMNIKIEILDDMSNPTQKSAFEDAYALYDETFVESEKDAKDSLLAGIGGRDERKAPWIVAIDQHAQRVCGGVVVTVFANRPFGAVGYLFADARTRGKGIGSRLQKAAFEYVEQFNRRQTGGRQASRIWVMADIENPSKMSFGEILATTLKSGMDPWGRARFWEKQGYLPLACCTTGEAFPFVVIVEAEDAQPTEALDLWVRQSRREEQTEPAALNTEEVTEDVALWLFGALDLNRSAYAPPFNDPALDKMIEWRKQHPEVIPSREYLGKLLSTETAFANILAGMVASDLCDADLADGIKNRKIRLGEAILQAGARSPGKCSEDAPLGLPPERLTALDALWDSEKIRPPKT